MCAAEALECYLCRLPGPLPINTMMPWPAGRAFKCASPHLQKVVSSVRAPPLAQSGAYEALGKRLPLFLRTGAAPQLGTMAWPSDAAPAVPRLSTDACACGLPLPAAAPAVRPASNITTWACKTAQAVGRAHPLDRIKQGGPGGTPCERRTDSGYILPRGSTRITLQASSGYGTSAAGSPPHAQRVAPRWPTSHRLASRPLRPSTRQLDIACRFARVARPAQRPSEQPPAGRSS